MAPGAHIDDTRSAWPRVLLVEDDESHVLALTVGLEREGYAVTAVRDGREALLTAFALSPDIVLLDVMLPGLPGTEICRELRAAGFEAPIIIVSSRHEELDVVIGIELGADDYVEKPYRMRELVARMSALMRRQRERTVMRAIQSQPVAPEHGSTVTVGDVSLDPARHEVRVRGQLVDLPLREFQVLEELLTRAGRVVSRDELLAEIWGRDYDGDPRIVATLVGRLRTRIEADPDEPTHITTIRGIGYRFNDRF